MGPPTSKISIAIILTALIIETVADLMTNRDTDRTIIVDIIRLGYLIRRLQVGRRKYNFVQTRVVVRI